MRTANFSNITGCSLAIVDRLFFALAESTCRFSFVCCGFQNIGNLECNLQPRDGKLYPKLIELRSLSYFHKPLIYYRKEGWGKGGHFVFLFMPTTYFRIKNGGAIGYSICRGSISWQLRQGFLQKLSAPRMSKRTIRARSVKTKPRYLHWNRAVMEPTTRQISFSFIVKV